MLLAATLLAATFLPAEARAEDAFGPTNGTVRRIESPDPHSGRGDGVYGRFNGDLALQVGGGVEGDFQVPTPRPLLLGNFSFYQTLGLYASYRESFADSDRWARVVSTGIMVSPFFLIRWPKSWESGRATWDLTVDSLALVGGISFPQHDNGGLFASPTAEFGLELGVPLLGRANGLFLRSRGQLTTGTELTPSAWLWLSWQGFVNVGILEVGK